MSDLLKRLTELEAKATKDWKASRTDMDSYTGNPEIQDGEAHHVAYLYRDPDQRAAFFGEHNRDDLALIVTLRNAWPEIKAALAAAYKEGK